MPVSWLSSILGCCLPSKSHEYQPHPQPSTIRHSTHSTGHPSLDPGSEDGYTSTPLPAYTPRPGMTIQEKTLEAHLGDPPISYETYHQHHQYQQHQHDHDQTPSNPVPNPAEYSTNEKQRLDWEELSASNPDSPNYNPNTNTNYNHNHNHYSHYNYYPYATHPRQEEVSSDVSSAISFPSSYGNTSTATRETPPPPYSPRVFSPVPSRSMSVSSNYPPQLPMAQLPTAALTQPPPVFQPGRHRRSIDEQLQHSASSTPVPRQRGQGGGARYSWESDRR